MREKELKTMKHKTINHLRKTGRILTCVFTLVFGIGYVAGIMLEENADQVNNFLGTRTSTTTGGGTYDSFTPDSKYLNADGSANTDALVQAHIDMGTRLAEEGTVLLKNENNALPLSTSSNNKVTLMGYRSTASYALYGMTIGSPVASSQNVSFRDALTTIGFDVNDVVADAYEEVSATYGSANITGTSYAVTDLSGHQYTVKEPTIDEIKESAGESFDSSINEYSDAAIVVVGRPTTEQGDYYLGDLGRDASQFSESPSKNVLSLSDNERAMITFAEENFDTVIVCVNTSNTMEIDELEEDDNIDSILWIGMPGNYGFYGVSNILAGNANPSGRLVDTYAADTSMAPAAQDIGLNLYTNGTSAVDSAGNTYDLTGDAYYAGPYLVQEEGIYVGYKYYETRYEDSIINSDDSEASSSTGVGAYNDTGYWNYEDEVTYPFGYGLSYTSYEQTIDSVSFASDYKTAEVTVTVENTGSVDGQSVIQLYGQSPYTDYDKEKLVEKASVQLLSYDKVEVAAGSKETVTIDVDLQYLASYDENGYETYIMEGGDYYFALGCNDQEEGSHAAINNILASKGYTTSDGMDAEGDSSAAYKFEWSDENLNLFSTSKAGVEITNQLEDMDINYYQQNTAVYLSRKKWATSWPSGITDLEATPEMVDYLTNDYYEVSTTDDVSGIEFGAEYSEDEDVNFTDMFGADYDDERWETVINKVGLENAIRYTASGDRSFTQLDEIYFLSSGSYTENGSVGLGKTLSGQSDEAAPWYVSTSDANASYNCNSYGAAPLMASTWNLDLLEEMGELWGNDCLFANYPMIWAPSINVHRTAYNGRNGEYYSEDGVLSGYAALAVGKGALEKGLIASIKHFAFNGQESPRMGLSTYYTEQAAREGELRGFQIALEGEYDDEGNRTSVLGIMTSYNRIGATYSGGHYGLMQGILRDEWDFNGYATSDKLNVTGSTKSTYMPYIEGIVASTTNYDMSINTSDETVWGDAVTDVAASISNDATVLNALHESLHYSLYTFSQSNLANWMTDSTQTVKVWNWWRVLYTALEYAGIACVGGGIIVYIVAEILSIIVRRKENTQTEGNSNE